MKSILNLFILINSTLFLIACNSKSESNIDKIGQNKKRVLTIDNGKINFSVQYQWKGEIIKPLLKKDTIILIVNYEYDLKKILKNNIVQIVPNVKNCRIQKVNDLTFWILFDKEYNEPMLRWTMYLIPKKNTIFSLNENKYYNFPERIFIAEKTNEILIDNETK